uniref:Uncharacterized protein n=1 Tax=viral metagenome TaxID=1070528 RepID=A0A6M3LNR3_9ZZZZ
MIEDKWRHPKWSKFLLDEIKKIPDNELVKGDTSVALMLFCRAGADAMLESIWDMARNSPTKTFTFDAKAKAD